MCIYIWSYHCCSTNRHTRNLKEGVLLIHINEYSVVYKIYECSEIDFTVTKLLNFLLARLLCKMYE